MDSRDDQFFATIIVAAEREGYRHLGPFV
jgi:hypothetical protein